MPRQMASSLKWPLSCRLSNFPMRFEADLLLHVSSNSNLQAQQLPDALRSRLAAARQQQQQQQHGWFEYQEQVPPTQPNGSTSPAFRFEFSTACSHELLVIFSTAACCYCCCCLLLLLLLLAAAVAAACCTQYSVRRAQATGDGCFCNQNKVVAYAGSFVFPQ